MELRESCLILRNPSLVSKPFLVGRVYIHSGQGDSLPLCTKKSSTGMGLNSKLGRPVMIMAWLVETRRIP